jgi:hypothetical protein
VTEIEIETDKGTAETEIEERGIAEIEGKESRDLIETLIFLIPINQFTQSLRCMQEYRELPKYK